MRCYHSMIGEHLVSHVEQGQQELHFGNGVRLEGITHLRPHPWR